MQRISDGYGQRPVSGGGFLSSLTTWRGGGDSLFKKNTGRNSLQERLVRANIKRFLGKIRTAIGVASMDRLQKEKAQGKCNFEKVDTRKNISAEENRQNNGAPVDNPKRGCNSAL